MADFSKDKGDVQKVGPNTKAPREHKTEPKTGFTEAPEGPNRFTNGPVAGIPGNRKTIR